jgi:hypothetical protein
MFFLQIPAEREITRPANKSPIGAPIRLPPAQDATEDIASVLNTQRLHDGWI